MSWDVEVTHVEHATTDFPASREGLGQEVIERFATSYPLPELGSPCRQLRIGEGLHLRFELVDNR